MYAECQLLREKRTKHWEEYEDALQKAIDSINKSAATLREKFSGAHNQKYDKQQILQVLHKKDNSRRMNPWNAFMTSELVKMNKGMPHYSIFPTAQR